MALLPRKHDNNTCVLLFLTHLNTEKRSKAFPALCKFEKKQSWRRSVIMTFEHILKVHMESVTHRVRDIHCSREEPCFGLISAGLQQQDLGGIRDLCIKAPKDSSENAG